MRPSRWLDIRIGSIAMRRALALSFALLVLISCSSETDDGAVVDESPTTTEAPTTTEGVPDCASIFDGERPITEADMQVTCRRDGEAVVLLSVKLSYCPGVDVFHNDLAWGKIGEPSKLKNGVEPTASDYLAFCP